MQDHGAENEIRGPCVTFLIACEPDRLGRHCYSLEGKPTDFSHAAEFGSWQEAKRFADGHGIKVNGAMVSIILNRKDTAH